jgi:hypothetical protein
MVETSGSKAYSVIFYFIFILYITYIIIIFGINSIIINVLAINHN